MRNTSGIDTFNNDSLRVGKKATVDKKTRKQVIDVTDMPRRQVE